jgi:hypothetical protein
MRHFEFTVWVFHFHGQSTSTYSNSNPFRGRSFFVKVLRALRPATPPFFGGNQPFPVALATSTDTPGPIVEEMETFFM